MKKIIWFLGVTLALSCSKSEGEGGNSSISGNVNLEEWNSTFTVLNYEDVAADYDVFIVYGDEIGYSDKTSTDHEGRFTFSYLREGDYSVYVYSKVTSAEAINGEAPDEEAVIQNVSLGKKEDLVLTDFTVLNN